MSLVIRKLHPPQITTASIKVSYYQVNNDTEKDFIRYTIKIFQNL